MSLGITDEREPDEAHEVEGAPAQVFRDGHHPGADDGGRVAAGLGHARTSRRDTGGRKGIALFNVWWMYDNILTLLLWLQ